MSVLELWCQPFHKLLKKNVTFEWDEACQKAFDTIKALLRNPPVLAAPIKGRPLRLYIAVSEQSLGALLAQENDKGKEQALYEISRRLLETECNYSSIEKICLALVFAAQKLRHYFLAHDLKLVSKADPLDVPDNSPNAIRKIGKVVTAACRI